MKTKNKRNYLKEKGITLIALVVTIAVLLILAGITISEVFDDGGLWDTSNEFAENVNATVEEKSGKINNMINELNEIMNASRQNKETSTTGETTGGNTAGGEDTQTTTENWTQTKTKVTNGTITYTVGEEYEYNCGVEGYTGGWKILGAEKGKLLIMSTVDVGTLGLKGISGDGTTTYPAGYINGIDKLNEMCAQYGTNARSITVEDINRVTGYTLEHQTISITSENKFYYDNDTSNQSSTATGTNAAYAGTYGLATALGITDGSPVTGNAWYYYYPNTLSTSSSGTTTGIATDSSAYEMLFMKADKSAKCSYWLASSYVYAYSYYAGLGMRYVRSDGYVSSYNLWISDLGTSKYSLGVRAVVCL